MKKLFSLFAAVLMAGSMMAEDATLISFNEPAAAGSLKEKTHESVLLYEMTTDEAQGSNNSYAGNCDIEMDGIVWNFTGNSQINPWRIGGKSLAAKEREVYTKTAYPAELDSVCLYLGNNTLTSLDGVKLVYSTNADFSDAEEVIAAVPEAFPATVTFAVEGGFPAKAYYKFVFTCTVSGSSNKFIQFNGVDFWGEKPAAPAVADPVFDLAAGSYYDEQTLHLTCETEGAAILYTTDGTDPVLGSASVYMAQYGIYLSAGTTTTIKAIAYNNDSDNPQFSEVVSKTYTIATVYNSFDELVNQAGAPAGQKVVVNFENVVIDSLYTTKAGKINGVYLTAAGRMVEIYCYDVPADWEVGGTISGVVKGDWKNYNGTWEVCPSSWDGITYKAAAGEVTPPADATFETYNATSFIYLIYNDTEWEATIAIKDNKMYIKNVLPFFANTKWIEGTIDNGVVTFAAGQVIGDLDLSLVDQGETNVYPDCKYYGFSDDFTREDVTFSWDAATKTLQLTNYESGAADDSLSEDETYIATDGWSDPDYVLTFVGTGVVPTAIENNAANMKAVKVLENGQVVIIREGVKYNVMGAKF